MQSTGTSSDIEGEIHPTDKYNYVLLVPDQVKISSCTKIQVLQETKYPESYLRVVRFLDNIEADSEIVPGSIYHDQTLLRVLFYLEIKYKFVKNTQIQSTLWTYIQLSDLISTYPQYSEIFQSTDTYKHRRKICIPQLIFHVTLTIQDIFRTIQDIFRTIQALTATKA
jgi:hypothetical protein